MRPFIWMFGAMLSGAASAAASAPPQGVVIGYIAAFKGLDQVIEDRGFGQYTHLDIAFVNPTPAGEVVTADGLACAPSGDDTMISDASLHGIVAKAHGNGTKLLLSLGGAVIPPCGGDWIKLLQPEMRSTVVSALVRMVDRYGLDGLDVDLEGELMTAIDRQGNYVPFVRDLAAALHARSKLLTAATGSYPGGMIPDGSLPYFDLIGIMSYDAVGPTWGTPGAEHSSYQQAETDLALWIRKGVPPARLALGMPFYGRGFGSYGSGLNLREIAGRYGDRQLDADVFGQRCGGCSYITYNGLRTLERKARLAGAWGAGVMVWEIGQDLPDGRAIRHVDTAYRRGRTDAAH